MSDATLATALRLPVKTVSAIRYVETGGRPSGSAAIRFEPHVFWRTKLGLPRSASGTQIRNAMSAAQNAQVPYTPCSTEWRTANGLPPCLDSQGHERSRAASAVAAETNRAAFERAFAVDPDKAVRATSWGAFQVLGGNLLEAYGGSPATAVAAFWANPADASERVLIKWFQNNPRGYAAARDQRWFDFVVEYNTCCSGSGETQANCRGCDVYLNRFTEGLRLEPIAEAAGGGLLFAAAAGLGLWWWSRRRR